MTVFLVIVFAKMVDPIVAFPMIFVGWRQHGLAYAAKIAATMAFLSAGVLAATQFATTLPSFVLSFVMSILAGMIWFWIVRAISIKMKGRVSARGI
jgi:hypothetical protein